MKKVALTYRKLRYVSAASQLKNTNTVWRGTLISAVAIQEMLYLSIQQGLTG